jgi:hypothetical protein
VASSRSSFSCSNVSAPTSTWVIHGLDSQVKAVDHEDDDHQNTKVQSTPNKGKPKKTEWGRVANDEGDVSSPK